jgi:hypothetical protein
MVLRGHLAGSAYIVSVKTHSAAVMVDERWVVAYDRGGRLYSVHRDLHTFRRGLSGHLLEKWQEGSVPHRRVVSPAGRAPLVDPSAGLLRQVVAGLLTPHWTWDEPADPAALEDAIAMLGRAARFDAEAARADGQAFNALYKPVGILPPDQYLSIVVQATEGCSFNTCTFCDLYHDGYRVKTPDEFRRHVKSVRQYLGASELVRSRGIFLGAANALAAPMARLRSFFECLREEFGDTRAGVFAFVDGFTGASKTVDDYRELKALGLRRVYIGLESGHDPLLAFVRKPGTAADAVETAVAIKAAGLELGVIVMIGLGGERFADPHARDTAAALNAIGLGEGDLLYFSDLVEVPGTIYPILAAQEKIGTLPPGQRRAQERAIRDLLRVQGTAPKMAVYDVREFVY